MEPGQVWWCDGVLLAFEPNFKRRPVLVIDISEDGKTIAVIPLSSRRHIGQEQLVTHQGGVSYFAGPPREIPRIALQKPLGTWEGFSAWSNPPSSEPSFWQRILNFLLRNTR